MGAMISVVNQERILAMVGQPSRVIAQAVGVSKGAVLATVNRGYVQAKPTPLDMRLPASERLMGKSTCQRCGAKLPCVECALAARKELGLTGTEPIEEADLDLDSAVSELAAVEQAKWNDVKRAKRAGEPIRPYQFPIVSTPDNTKYPIQSGFYHEHEAAGQVRVEVQKNANPDVPDQR